MRCQFRPLRETESTFLTEIVQPLDSRCSYFSKCIKKDFDGVRHKETLDIMSSNSLPATTNIPRVDL